MCIRDRLIRHRNDGADKGTGPSSTGAVKRAKTGKGPSAAAIGLVGLEEIAKLYEFCPELTVPGAIAKLYNSTAFGSTDQRRLGTAGSRSTAAANRRPRRRAADGPNRAGGGGHSASARPKEHWQHESPGTAVMKAEQLPDAEAGSKSSQGLPPSGAPPNASQLAERPPSKLINYETEAESRQPSN